MNERIRLLAEQAGGYVSRSYEHDGKVILSGEDIIEKFAELIVRECLDKIETYRIPVGNSAAGEMACEMTYSVLMEIRDEIREHFGVKE